VLRQAFERFPAEIEAVEIGVRIFELCHDADCVSVVIETARIGEGGIEGVLACMSERWVAEVVSEAERLRQVFVQAKGASDRPTDLSDFEAVRQTNAIMIAIGRNEDLGLVP
jgi:hypothetical protein